MTAVKLCLFGPERLPADGEQSAEGAAEAAGEPEHFPQQPDGGAAAAHHHAAGAELGIAHADGEAAGTLTHV